MKIPGASALKPYVLAALAVAAAIAARLLLDPLLGDKMPFVTVFLVIVGTAWLAGVGPALLATLLGSLGAVFFILEPRYSFAIAQPEYRFGIGVMVVLSLGCAALFASLRNARSSAEARLWEARLREQQLHYEATERSTVESVLRESEERFRGMFNQVAVGVGLTSLDRVVLDVNPGLCHMLGYEREELIGLRVTDLSHCEEHASSAEVMRPLLAGEVESVDMQRRFRHKDGHYIWTRTIASLIHDASGRPHSVVSIVEDVTERKRAEEALHEADRRKDEFLATLAHELRNPLAPISNSLHLLRLAGSDVASQQEVVEMMERQVGHMVRLVDDLLEVSRITRDKIELRRERVELAAVVRCAVEASKPFIDAAGQQLAIVLPREPVLLDADGVRLSQVFTNLLNNASKYTQRGGQIWLTARLNGDTDQSPSNVAVAVRDNGIGISPAMLPRVFDMFVQSDDSREQSKGGLGIGLTLVRKLVELHGGSVEARSSGPGTGSEFLVSLPLAKEQPAVNQPPELAGMLPATTPLSVLIVDDNRDAADSLAMILKRLNCAVRTVYDGYAALEALGQHRPALVLLDIGMPGIDGYEVIRQARLNPANEDVVFCALTGWGQESDRKRAKEAGFSQHLIKPVNLTQLQSLLAAVQFTASQPPAGPLEPHPA